MSRLDELIAELCPDGVEYKTLNTIAHVNRGVRVVRKQLLEEGTFPVYQNSLIPLGYTEKMNCPQNTPFVISAGAAGEIGYSSTPFWAADDCLYILGDANKANNRYLYHVLLWRQHYIKARVRKASIPRLSRTVVERLVVPVPPIEVQREIVRVLDNFTLLTAELTAELQLRKKQYEYYRNYMLTFETEVQHIPMGELFDFRNGLSKGKEFFGRGTPFIRYTDVYNHRSLRKSDLDSFVECSADELQKLKVSRGDVLFTRTSETAEDVGWSSVMLDDMDDCVFNGFTIKASPKTKLLWPEYCAYCFATDDFRNYVKRHCAFTTRASLTGSTIAEYRLAVPSLNVQKKIAEVLDNFESICNDLSIGLPGEIEARQKQYEYYRDLLLTFAEADDKLVVGRSSIERT